MPSTQVLLECFSPLGAPLVALGPPPGLFLGLVGQKSCYVFVSVGLEPGSVFSVLGTLIGLCHSLVPWVLLRPPSSNADPELYSQMQTSCL